MFESFLSRDTTYKYIFHTGRALRKHFGHVRTAEAQISLRIRAVWSGPSLSAYRIIEQNRIYQWTANFRMNLCACVGWNWMCILHMLEDTFSLGATHIDFTCIKYYLNVFNDAWCNVFVRAFFTSDCQCLRWLPRDLILVSSQWFDLTSRNQTYIILTP